VVVNNYNGTHGFVFVRFTLFFNGAIPDHVQDGLEPGGIAFALNVLIRFLSKLTINGNTKTCNI